MTNLIPLFISQTQCSYKGPSFLQRESCSDSWEFVVSCLRVQHLVGRRPLVQNQNTAIKFVSVGYCVTQNVQDIIHCGVSKTMQSCELFEKHVSFRGRCFAIKQKLHKAFSE